MKNLDNEFIKIADLSKIRLNSAEIDKYKMEFKLILDYFDQLQSVSVGEIEPLICPVPITLKYRSDQQFTSVERESILTNAPDRQGHLFVVPPVL